MRDRQLAWGYAPKMGSSVPTPTLSQSLYSRLALLLLCLGLGSCGTSGHPSDAELLKNFTRNEAGFEKLLTMIRADKALQRVDDTWTRPEDPASAGIGPDRIQAYRALFATLGIPRGFYAWHDPENFTFLASTSGLGISGSAKGYAYLSRTPEPVVPSLDGYQSPDGKSFTAYRHIKGSWYLYLDHED
jgi:hypothetical protein